MIPGRSALEEEDRNLQFRLVCLACILVLAASAAILPDPLRELGILGGAVGAVFTVPLWYGATMASMRAEDSERHAGYTTLYDRANCDLPQLDPKTGAVIRRAGEEPINRHG
jgi:hypothetical protein